jgi:hypothetical protein
MTYPHNPKRKPSPFHKPLLHEENRRRVRKARPNCICDPLRYQQVRRRSRKRSSNERKAHDEKADRTRISLELRFGNEQAKHARREDVYNALNRFNDDQTRFQAAITFWLLPWHKSQSRQCFPNP